MWCYFPLTSEDAQQHYHLGTGREQCDPGTPSAFKRGLARTGHYWRGTAKNPYLPHGNEAKRLNYVLNHMRWGAKQWQQVLWTDEFKILNIVAVSGRQFVPDSLESICRQQRRTVKVSCSSEIAFLQMYLAIWWGLMVLSIGLVLQDVWGKRYPVGI